MHRDITDAQALLEQQSRNHQVHVNSNAHQTCYIVSIQVQQYKLE